MVHGAWFSDVGTREINEDAANVVEENGRLVAVVADGLGGQGGGDVASAIAVKQLCNLECIGGNLHEQFMLANDLIMQKQIAGQKMMTTVVALHIEDRHARWAHMGDARLYHFYEGRLLMQTHDHSVSQMAVYRNEITQAEIRFHEDRNRVLRALGGDEEVKEEQNDICLEEGFHSFLLCTDGFWEYVLEEEMEQALRCAPTPEDWLVKMCNILQEKKAAEHDNFTAAAVFYTGENR